MKVTPLKTIPTLLFVLIAVAFGMGLNHKLQATPAPSPLVGSAVPSFNLPSPKNTGQTLSSGELRGSVVLLNLFASWCAPCREELPVLKGLHDKYGIKIYGIALHDNGDALDAFFRLSGNPYTSIGMDSQGKTMIALGVVGIPETFIIDRAGIIRYKHIGPIAPEDVRKVFIPLIERLKNEKI